MALESCLRGSQRIPSPMHVYFIFPNPAIGNCLCALKTSGLMLPMTAWINITFSSMPRNIEVKILKACANRSRCSTKRRIFSSRRTTRHAYRPRHFWSPSGSTCFMPSADRLLTCTCYDLSQFVASRMNFGEIIEFTCTNGGIFFNAALASIRSVACGPTLVK